MTAPQTDQVLAPIAKLRDGIRLRPGKPTDLDALVDLENETFDGDRLARRNFRHLLDSPTSVFVVADAPDGTSLAGYALVLTRSSTALARLYSLAVSRRHRGAGLARELLEAAEDAAYQRGAIALRLEVRSDNVAAIRLYQRAGYRQFGAYPDYYEDSADALRFEKLLTPHEPPLLPVPFYEQQTDFTCGAACVMMALGWALDDWRKKFGLELETQIWREATTIYMTSGHGGCGPIGLALSLAKRGLDVEVWT